MYIADYFTLYPFYNAIDTILMLHVTIHEDPMGQPTRDSKTRCSQGRKPIR